MNMAGICCKLVFRFSASLAIINFYGVRIFCHIRFCHGKKMAMMFRCLDVIVCLQS